MMNNIFHGDIKEVFHVVNIITMRLYLYGWDAGGNNNTDIRVVLCGL